MTDTGTSCIAGPSRFTDYILETIYDTRKYIFWQGDNSLDCSKKSELPSFDLLFGGYWFRVNVEDYVYQDGDLCYVCIDDSGDESWILGDAFMRGYYNIHDLTNMRMGFYSIDEKAKPVPKKASISPEKWLPEAVSRIWGLKKGFLIFLVCIVSLLVILGIALIIFFCFFKKSMKALKERKTDF